MSILSNSAILICINCGWEQMRNFIVTLLMFSIAALTLPHFCCCIKLPSSATRITKHSCCSSGISSHTNESRTKYGIHSLKRDCECEEHSSISLFIDSNLDETVATKHRTEIIYVDTFLAAFKDSSPWTAYNIKRGPPDHIGKSALKTYQTNQRYLL